jgi:hypothetical protein
MGDAVAAVLTLSARITVAVDAKCEACGKTVARERLVPIEALNTMGADPVRRGVRELREEVAEYARRHGWSGDRCRRCK